MTRPQLKVTPPPPDDGAFEKLWITGDQVAAAEPRWLLPGRVVGNGLVILEGDSSAGKSVFLAHLVSAVTTGKPWLGRPKSAPARVLWLTGEEDFGSMIEPRLYAAGADVGRVVSPRADDTGAVRQLYLPGCMGQLADAVGYYNLAVIIIEPLVSFVGHDISMNQEGPARSVVDPLNRLAFSSGCTVIVTRGLRKDRSGPRLAHGSGHGTIASTARTVLQLERPDPEQERRVLRTIKCGLASGPVLPLEYTHEKTRGAPRIVGLHDLVGADDPAAEAVDVGERDTRADARQMLKSMCATNYVPVKTILSAAKESAIGERTLRKVKAELRVHSRWNRQEGTGFHEWGPPLTGWESSPIIPPVQPKRRAALPKKPRKSRGKKAE